MKAKAKTKQKNSIAKPKYPKPLKPKVDKQKDVALKRIIGLESLKSPLGACTKTKILGRGPSSGHGKTSTRGSKGQSSRAGRDFYLGFEGGQVPLIRKTPKRGFSNLRFKRDYQIVNLKDLVKIKEITVDPQILRTKGLIKNKDRLIKILGEGELAGPLEVKAHAFSKTARKKIEEAGGKIEIINVNA